MKIIRSTPALNFGRSLSNLGPWSRHPLAGLPAVAQILEDFFPATVNALSGRLATDVHEDAGNYYARFELPGVKKEAVKVELKEGVLTISADRVEKSGEGESTTSLGRSITLPDTVVPSNAGDEALLHAVGVIDGHIGPRLGRGCAGHPRPAGPVQLIGDAFVWHDGHAGRGI